MSQQKDQFDGPDEEYDTLVNQIYDFLTTAPIPAIGIPSGTMTDYLALLTPFNTSWGIVKTKSTATEAHRTTFHTNRGNLTTFLRTFVKMWLYDNVLATDTMITSTGMRLHSTSRISHNGAPADTPVQGLTPITGHRFDVNIRTVAGKIGKPDGVHLIRVRYFLGEGAPADPAKFASFQDFTRNPILLILAAENAGQKITIASCYVSGTGAIEGNYCTVIITNVP
jgi:hypothetical protein